MFPDQTAPAVPRPDDTAAVHAADLGGKALALTRLQQAGFNVPPFMVLPPSALTGSLPPDADLPALLEREDFPWPPGLLAFLQQALLQIAPNGESLAVRSSAMAEDGAEQSFAGQYESLLGVCAEEVPAAILKVWQSAFRQSVAAYGGAQAARLPAVIVQCMLNAESAGVAFSSDPVTGQRMNVSIAAVPGLGSALVSGECNGDGWTVSHAGQITASSITAKKIAHRLDAANGQVVTLPVPEPYASQPALKDDQVLAVARLALQAADLFECPQDIEWALAEGKLYILQSRPLTTLHRLPDPDGLCQYWDNTQLIDCYSGVTTPLTHSFARRFYGAYYLQLCRLLGQSPRQLEAAAARLEHALGFVRNRIYYNMSRLEPVLSPLPNARTLAWEGIGHLPRQIKAGWRVFQVLRQRPASVRAFFRNTQRLLQPGQGKQPQLHLLRADQLVEYYEDLEALLRYQWQAVVGNDFLAGLCHEFLKRLVKRWCNDPEAALVNDLLCGETGIISLEPTLRLQAMARTAATQPNLLALLKSGDAASVQRDLPAYPDFAAQLQTYWEDFGDRCLEDLKLESPAMSENPLMLYRQVARMAEQDADRRMETAHTLRLAAESKARALMGKNPLKRQLFFAVLDQTRRIVKDRENMRFEMTRMMGRLRQIFRLLGRRLKEERLLAHSDDVFFLTLEEVLGVVLGTAPSMALQQTVALRRAEYEQNRQLPAPAIRFTTRGMVPVGNDLAGMEGTESPDTTTASSNGMLKGQACCPGVIKGRVRRVSDPEAASLEPGEILVAERSDPGWVLLFPAASGLLFEHGHALCHAAIVAREMGIPTVVALDGLTRWVADGEWVEIDGRAGTVRKVEP